MVALMTGKKASEVPMMIFGRVAVAEPHHEERGDRDLGEGLEGQDVGVDRGLDRGDERHDRAAHDPEHQAEAEAPQRAAGGGEDVIVPSAAQQVAVEGVSRRPAVPARSAPTPCLAKW